MYENIKTKEDFLKFIEELRKDLRENKDKWENLTLEDYLEALEAYAKDIDSAYKNQGKEAPENVNWNYFADILKGASIYE